MAPAVVFDNVSKKFRRGERLNSLRDTVPALVRSAFRRKPADQLGDQEFWALRDVSFEVQPGEALGIIGPNGAGKSTTLKLLTKILRPTMGRCAVHGRVGALIEVAAGFHPDLTGRENVYLQGAIMGMKRAEIERRFDEIVEFAGVGGFVDTPVKRYSSGMNARLGFSIAAHLEPDVLIIDEVLSVGDIRFQEKCVARMQAFVKSGTSIVFVSHNLSAISQLCGRTLLLVGGKPAHLGPTAGTIAMYCRTQVLAEHRNALPVPVGIHVRVPEVLLSDDSQVDAGDPIEFSIDVEFREARQAVIVGIVVWDVTQGTRVYGATSDAFGIPVLSGRPGDVASLDIAFNANLVRGTYALEVNLFDTALQEAIAVQRPVAQFTVTDNTSLLGVANLFMRGTRVRVQQPV